MLEFGCGTGQATLPLAECGFEIVCVELGEQLAELARRKLASFPNAEVVNAAFESWEPVRADFDAADEFAAAGFTAVEVRRHLWEVAYGPDEYIAVPHTYSGNRLLDPATRRRLFDRIRTRIDEAPDRKVRKTYLATLTIGRRP